MNSAFILLGGNIGNRQQLLADAMILITQKAGEIAKFSAIYETDAWGFEADQKFLNQVLEIMTIYTPQKLLAILKDIELKLGRIRKTGDLYNNRSIDLDILFYNNIVIQEEDLQIPHPRLHLRKFTLLPLLEIAQDKIHPGFNQNIADLLYQCDDELNVTLFKPARDINPSFHEI